MRDLAIWTLLIFSSVYTMGSFFALPYCRRMPRVDVLELRQRHRMTEVLARDTGESHDRITGTADSRIYYKNTDIRDPEYTNSSN